MNDVQHAPSSPRTVSLKTQLPQAVATAIAVLGMMSALLIAALAIAVSAVILPFALFAQAVLGPRDEGARRGWQAVAA